MDICPPAILTSACFIAVVLLDLYTHDWARAPGHALFGVFAVLLMIFICQKGSTTMAWILLAAPFVLVLFAWIARSYSQMTKYDAVPQQEPAWGGNEVGCGQCSRYMPCSCPQPRPVPVPNPTPSPTPNPTPNPTPAKPNCGPKNKPTNENSYFELWLTTR